MSRISEFMGALPSIGLIRAWKRAAGPIFADKARFYGVEDRKGVRTLVLSIEDPIWKQEFNYQKETLLDLYRLEMKIEGFKDADLPTEISLNPKHRMPFKSRNP